MPLKRVDVDRVGKSALESNVIVRKVFELSDSVPNQTSKKNL